jgi:predicted acyl esterase
MGASLELSLAWMIALCKRRKNSASHRYANASPVLRRHSAQSVKRRAGNYRRLSLASGDPRRRTTTVEALPVAWRLDVGHRLRLLVAAGAFPRFARNLGLGEPLAIATESRDVDITVHCGAGASFISI